MDEQVAKISQLIASNAHSYISFDTEFAGFLRFGPQSLYEQVRQNVNQLKLIQLGLTVADQSERISGSWQFNFYFDRVKD